MKKLSRRSFPFAVIATLLLLSGCKKEESVAAPAPATPAQPLPAGPMTDTDGNTYATVTIGTQVWMAENLRVSRYRDGSLIENVTDATTWASLITGGWINYQNNVANDLIYGKLYNWYAVSDPRGLCPQGWHVPNNPEWWDLVTFLGGENVAGGKLKTTGTIEEGTGLWYAPNAGASNATGFSALPSGWRNSVGSSFDLGRKCYLWSASPSNTENALAREMDYYSGAYLDLVARPRISGFCVRCLRD